MTKSNRRPSSVARRSKKVRRPALRLERLENRVVFAGDAPVAWNDVFHTPQDQSLEVSASGVLANDTDNEFDSLTAELFSPPAHGSVELLPDGSFRYTPESGFTGLDAFLYRAGDGTSSSKLAAVTLRVDDRQIAPVAQADAYQLDEDTSLTIGGPGVLANDTDADGDTLAATLVTGPQHGTVTLNADGSFTYTPDANFAGTDGFSYIASDGSLSSDAASVTIEVRATPDAPVAANDAFAVDEDGTLVIDAAGVLANDTDADGDTLAATLVTGPEHGTVTLNADGSFTYTPDANFAGTDGFSYTAGDGSLSSDAASVTIEVRAMPDAPVAANDAFAVDEDGTLVIDAAGVLANDTDADGDALTATLVTGPQHGTVTLNADGSFTYTPNANFAGTDEFTYTAGDGSLASDVASVSIEVRTMPDAPVAANDAFAVDEDGTLVIDAAGVLANDTDADGDTLTAALVTGPQHGTVTLNADGSFTYTPNANFAGTDEFSYTAGDGSLASDVASVSIEVRAMPDAPVAANDEFAVDEDGTLVIDAAGVLANDTDADGDALTATLVTGPQHGTVTLNADGSFTYTPNANFAGTDGFSYTAGDGSLSSDAASVTIEVRAMPDAPVAANDAFAVDEDGTLVIDAAGLLANDTDADGDALTATLVTGPQHGTVTLNADGSFTYTPNANFAGTDGFSYTAGDGSLSSDAASVTIEVRAMPDAPVAANDAFAVDEDGTLVIDAAGVLANDTDADGDALTATLVTGPQHGTVTLNADGSFTYTPNANFAGTDGFSYTAGDGSFASDAASVTIEVRATADAPVAANDEFAVDEDGTLVIDAAGVLANDTDADGDALTATLVTGPQHGTVTLNADGSFTYTPDANFAGTDGFSYTAGDGSLSSDAASVTIEVRATPDAPVAANDEFAVDEDGTLVIDAAGVLANDTDADGDALTATLVTGPQHGTVTLNADGSFTYTPDANFAGTDGFSYTAGDGSLSSDAASVTIEVREVIDSPATLGDAYNVGEDNELIVGTDRGVLVNDIDLQDLPLTAELAEGPAHGTVTVAADGSFHYQPEANFFGVDSFTYVASNGSNSSAPTRVNIVVQTINDAPTAMVDEYRLGADGTLVAEATAGVVANDQDVEGDTLTATLVSAPRFGTLVLNADGSFLYSAKGDYRGPDSFRYQVNDGMSNGNVVTVSILAAELPATNLPEIPSSEVPDNTTPPAGDVSQEDTPAEGEPTPCHPVVAEPPADALADDSSPCSPWQRTNDDWGWLADVGRRHGHGCAHDWLFSQERWWA